MLPSYGGRRLVVVIRGAAAAAAGGANRFQPQSHAACSSHRYSSTPAEIAPDPKSSHTTAEYLVGSCGLSPAVAAALASRRIRIVSRDKADAVLALLRRHGFSDAQIARLLRLAPTLLLVDPDRVIRPKLEFFASLGFPIDFLVGKTILERSLENHIVPSVEFLRGILGTDTNIRIAVSRHPYALMFDHEKTMRPALQALRRHGLTEETISKIILLKIGVLGLTPDRIAGIIEDLKVLGVPISDSRFVYNFSVMSSVGREAWLRKIALFRSFGVSEDELLKAFRTQATIMLVSDESIKKKFRFFREELKLDLSHVMQRPVVLGYSLEKCILPRCAVLSVLMRDGKIERDINLLPALLGSSKYFLNKYVLRYGGKVPDVVGAYEGKIKFEGFKDQMS